MKTTLSAIILALLFAAGTRFFGWWTVPLIAFAYGLTTSSSAWLAALGALFAWAGWLAYDAAEGPVGRLATLLGAIFHAPAALLLVATLVYPMILAACAAEIGAGAAAVFRAPPTTRRRARS
jgi:hypothetical protein